MLVTSSALVACNYSDLPFPLFSSIGGNICYFLFFFWMLGCSLKLHYEIKNKPWFSSSSLFCINVKNSTILQVIQVHLLGDVLKSPPIAAVHIQSVVKSCWCFFCIFKIWCFLSISTAITWIHFSDHLSLREPIASSLVSDSHIATITSIQYVASKIFLTYPFSHFFPSSSWHGLFFSNYVLHLSSLFSVPSTAEETY